MSGAVSRKILFVLPNLHGGGSERVVLTLLKHLNRDRFRLHLAVVVDEGEFRSLVPDDVEVTYLRRSRVREAFLPLVRLIRRVKPDTVFSTLGHLNLLMIMLKPLFPHGTRLIVRESIVVSELLKEPGEPWFFKYLYARLYPRADLIVCQSEDMRRDLSENFGIPRDKMVQIYNPVDCDGIRDGAAPSENPFKGKGEGPHIVSAGRLSHQKGFDNLVRAFHEFRTDYPRAKLWILGTGPLLASLHEQCERLGLVESVAFAGFRYDLHVWLKHADLFVLASRYEGLPNVLLEALACGCPVVATDCPGGTREIMELTGNGSRLMPMDDFRLTADMLEQPPDPEIQRALRKYFGPESVIAAYEKLLVQ